MRSLLSQSHTPADRLAPRSALVLAPLSLPGIARPPNCAEATRQASPLDAKADRDRFAATGTETDPLACLKPPEGHVLPVACWRGRRGRCGRHGRRRRCGRCGRCGGCAGDHAQISESRGCVQWNATGTRNPGPGPKQCEDTTVPERRREPLRAQLIAGGWMPSQKDAAAATTSTCRLHGIPWLMLQPSLASRGWIGTGRSAVTTASASSVEVCTGLHLSLCKGDPQGLG